MGLAMVWCFFLGGVWGFGGGLGAFGGVWGFEGLGVLGFGGFGVWGSWGLGFWGFGGLGFGVWGFQGWGFGGLGVWASLNRLAWVKGYWVLWEWNSLLLKSRRLSLLHASLPTLQI